MTEFLGIKPTLEDSWRSIILFGKNVACYKLALGKALLKLAPKGKTIITLEELAEPYARYVVEHLQLSNAQSQDGSNLYPFLEACRKFNQDELSQNELIEITAREGFKVVLDKFHNLSGLELPLRFYSKRKGGITLTDELLRLTESDRFTNLPQEVEARWRLVETAWLLKISRNLVQVNYDNDQEIFFTHHNRRRINVTSCRDSLNGYQKGKCFYCFAPISLEPESEDFVDVDHFFPHILGESIKPINGVWNLVLSCQRCNRGSFGKFERLPHLRYLERLHTRNEFLISSHHPLRDTLIQQTGQSESDRGLFLNSAYNEAQRRLATPVHLAWQVMTEYPAAF